MAAPAVAPAVLTAADDPAVPVGIDVIYPAWNRLEITRITFGLLIDNTDWRLVRNLIVYEDGSEDGTREHLDAQVAYFNRWAVEQDLAARASLSYLGYRSPVRTMNHYIERDPAPLFAKIDNDIAVPPGWLNDLAAVMERSPELEILGMQAGFTGPEPRDDIRGHGLRFLGDYGGHGYGWVPCPHIGGVGLMRSAAFTNRRRMIPHGRFGFTSWQQTGAHPPVTGWINPDLLCPQLDLLPIEPWRTLSDGYTEKGWQRAWPPYDPASHAFWDWIPGL